MKVLLRDVGTVLSVLAVKKRVFIGVTVSLIVASLIINVAVLSAVTGKLPSAMLLNDGSFRLQADIDDHVDRFLEAVFPLYNYPLALVMFPREFVITNELGLKENVIASQPLFVTLHYFADFAPFAVLISAYTILSRYYFSNRGHSIARRKASKKGLMVGAGASASPSVGSGATTALTALAGGICCGAFAVETSFYVLGFAIGAAGLVFISRIFLLLMGGFLVLGIFRTARKINTSCTLPGGMT